MTTDGMKILVTGANGQLGREMRLVSEGLPFKFIFSDVVPAEGLDTQILDITDINALRQLVRDEGIGAIVNCAAYTNVDKAETDEAFCALLNATAPGNLATVMNEVRGLLVHISTDYVFGKEPYNTPCTEDRTGTPTGVYGRTKLDGERNIIASGCDYVIIRTAWLYSEFGKNFCKTMLSLTETKPTLSVVFDQVGTPTYALDLARVIAVVLRDYAGACSPAAGVEASACSPAACVEVAGAEASAGGAAAEASAGGAAAASAADSAAAGFAAGAEASAGGAAAASAAAGVAAAGSDAGVAAGVAAGAEASAGVAAAASAADSAAAGFAAGAEASAGVAGRYAKTGIYHYSNEGVCSWYDFTKMIAEYAGHTACRISPCHSSEFPSPVVRPAYSVLDKTKIKTVFGVQVPYWTESLRLCLANLLR